MEGEMCGAIGGALVVVGSESTSGSGAERQTDRRTDPTKDQQKQKERAPTAIVDQVTRRTNWNELSTNKVASGSEMMSMGEGLPKDFLCQIFNSFWQLQH
jgi:hypothetical protein